MAMIDNDWLPAIQGEFRKPYYKELFQFVKEEYNRTVIYPPSEDIFNALHLTPLHEVKVLILGQDPYHNDNQAHGLSFSVPLSQKEIPPSLQNIYQELHDDLGCEIPDNGYLEKWAKQGVLLLNTVHIRQIPTRGMVGNSLRTPLYRQSMRRSAPSCIYCGENRRRAKFLC